MHVFRFAALMAAAIAAVPASQSHAFPDAPREVVVATVSEPILKNYRQFMRGLDAFEKKRALAPAAAPLFRLVPTGKGIALAGVTMRIAGDTVSVQVPVNPDGTFEMPRSQPALDEDAAIFLNKKRGAYHWRPQFMTPDLPPNTRRLGDLRLECEVILAAGTGPDVVEPRLADTIGFAPCRSGALKVTHWSPRRIVGYSLVSGTRRQAFVPPASPDRAQLFWVPLHDASWPDDALVEFVYAPQA